MSNLLTDVPEGWKIQRLKRVCKLRKRTKLPPLREIANIPMALIPEDGKYATFIMKSIDDIKSGDICKEGDILLAGITPSFENGKQGIVPQLPSKYAITSTEAFPIICDPDVETHFIFHLLKYEFTRRIIASRMEGSTGRQRVPSDVLMNFHIPVPPLVEQRGIVEVLGTVDECIRLTDAVIERAEELKRGLMQRLLTRGIGHTEYKETKVGEIPLTWKLSSIGDITDVKGGKRLPKGHGFLEGPSTHPYIRVIDFKNGKININQLRYISEDTFNIIKKYVIASNDVYISIAGTIGLCGTIPKSLDGANLTENAAKITNIKKILPRFLSYYLNSIMGQKQIESLTGQTSQPKLALFRVQKIMVPIPPYDEQEKILKIFSLVDSKLDSEKAKKSGLTSLKQGLMQILLSGKTRVELKGDGLHRIRDGREANN